MNPTLAADASCHLQKTGSTPRRGARGWLSLGAIALISSALLAVGGPAAHGQTAQGFRVYTIVLDGLEPWEVNPTLMPNLSRLKSQGTWYEQARAVLPSETLPNHIAMMTGVLPQRNGIIGNSWVSPNYCQQCGYSDMDRPEFLEADTLTTRLENRFQLATATVQSKTYLWGVFRGEAPRLDDPNPQREADFHWRAPFYITFSDHHPDTGTMDAFRGWFRAQSPPVPQFAFVNLGDIDRAGHADESGALTAGSISAFRQAVIADTDSLVGHFVDELKSSGAWDDTVLIVTSDHGMDWSDPAGPNSVDVTGTLQSAGYSYAGLWTDTPGTFHTVAGGGTAAVYANDADVPALARALAAHPGVAFVATPQSVPELGNPTLSDVGLDHPNNGKIVAFVKAGWAVRDGGNQTSRNPLPGNHGHPETQPSVLMVTGGHDVVDDQPESVPGEAVYDPGKLFSPPAGGPGNLSVAPTVAALFGIGEPAGGYDGSPLSEAFEPYAFDPHTPGEAARPRPDVSIDKSDRPDPIRVGRTLTYTLAVRNAGPSDATGVTVVDELPADLKPVAISTSQGSCSQIDQRVTCDLGELSPGGAATVTIQSRPQRRGTISNQATVSLNEIDADGSNNVDTEVTQILP